jgi:hypothetical protein
VRGRERERERVVARAEPVVLRQVHRFGERGGDWWRFGIGRFIHSRNKDGIYRDAIFGKQLEDAKTEAESEEKASDSTTIKSESFVWFEVLVANRRERPKLPISRATGSDS